MKYSQREISLEIFPTTESCSAGCNHCPLSRRLDKNPSKLIHPEVLKTAHAITDAAHHYKQPVHLIYAGHIDSLADHAIKLIKRPEQIQHLRFGYNPKDQRAFTEQIAVLKNQIEVINTEIPGLALHEFSGTIYPKRKFTLLKREQKFLVSTLKAMKELTGVYDKRCEYIIDLHANMIPFKEFEKKYSSFEKGDSDLFNNLFGKLNLFGAPKVIQKGFTTITNTGVCFTGKLSLAGFDPAFKKIIEVKTRYITRADYALGAKERDKQLHQAISLINEHADYGVFSPMPEGVMIMHSSQHITNPVIWISHDEFREVLEQAVKQNVPLSTFARKILISNWELMKKQPTIIPYMKSMKLFKELREESPIL